MDKKALRKTLKQQRSDLGADARARIDSAIAEHCVALPEFQAADTVFSYLSVGDEVDTRAIIRAAWAAGKRVAVPRCVAGTRLMDWYAIDSFEGLETSSFGIEEPVADPTRALDPATAGKRALAIVPGLAFNAEGFRIGYGGGFYDVFLSTFSGASIGLCRTPFFNTVDVPRDAHDLPVDIVVTDGTCACL